MKKIIICILASLVFSQEETFCSKVIYSGLTFICINDMLFLERSKIDSVSSYAGDGVGLGVGFTYISDKTCTCEYKKTNSPNVKSGYNVELITNNK